MIKNARVFRLKKHPGVLHYKVVYPIGGRVKINPYLISLRADNQSYNVIRGFPSVLLPDG